MNSVITVLRYVAILPLCGLYICLLLFAAELFQTILAGMLAIHTSNIGGAFSNIVTAPAIVLLPSILYKLIPHHKLRLLKWVTLIVSSFYTFYCFWALPSALYNLNSLWPLIYVIASAFSAIFIWEGYNKVRIKEQGIDKGKHSKIFDYGVYILRVFSAFVLGLSAFIFMFAIGHGIIFLMTSFHEGFCSVYKGAVMLPFGAVMSHSEYCPKSLDWFSELWFNIVRFSPASYSAVIVAADTAPGKSKKIVSGLYVLCFALPLIAHPILAFLASHTIPLNGLLWNPGNFIAQMIYLIAALVAFYHAFVRKNEAT